MKAKLFKFLPIQFKKSDQNSNEFQLKEPVEIKAEDYLSNLKFQLPAFIKKLLQKKITIKNIIWRKQKQTIIEAEINLKPVFKNVEKYMEFNEAILTVSTTAKIITPSN